MNIIFFGNTPKSLIGAKILHEELGITAIVTIPDRIGKRGESVQSPLKLFGIEKKIPVLTVNKLDAQATDEIAALKPDFLVVEDYGLILPQKVLSLPKFAPLNVHHSLLPKYRGPAPAPFAILAGDLVTGVSIIHMNEQVDAGAIYAQQKYTMTSNETTDSLLSKLNELGGALVVKVIQEIVASKATPTPQNESEATLTYYMNKTDGYLSMDNLPTKEQIDRMIRAYFPWPNVWTKVSIKNKETRIKFLPEKKLQVEGKSTVSIKDFINGYPDQKSLVEKVF